MSAPKSVCFILHAHLPFGQRPDLPISLEECWLFEAVTDCYLPLLQLIESLPKPARLALSLSPTLLDMWAQPTFPERYRAHLERLTGILEAEACDESHPIERRELAEYYQKQIQTAQAAFFNQWQGNLPAAFGRLAKAGRVELFTTAATHAFLPAHQNSAFTRQLQIGLGVERFTALTGVEPKGFWLPECGYFPGLERDLAAAGIEWFVTEDMGGPSVLRCPNGVTALARHHALSRKVWDAQVGYPGHPQYREFHQDAIHELPTERAGLYRLPDGGSLPLGLKYWRVTGARQKDWYDPAIARAQAESNAADFVLALEESEETFITLPFDAELFGHWWHEGPHWLSKILALTASETLLKLTSPSQALKDLHGFPTKQPKSSTWGRRSDFSFWINPETDWIYPQLRSAERLLEQIKTDAPEGCLRERALAQMTRELLLAQASDWPFMLRAGATANYAEERLRRCLNRFHYLARELKTGQLTEENLSALETLDALFPGLAI